MSSFPRTTRALLGDPPAGRLPVFVAATLLLLAWVAWFALAHTTLVALSRKARLESGTSAHPVEAPVAGRVVARKAVLSQRVVQGDVLFEIDAAAERLALAEATARLDALLPRFETLEAEIRAEEGARSASRLGAGAARSEVYAKQREADEAARQAEDELERLERLHREGLVSEREFARARSDAKRSRALAEGLAQAGVKTAREGDTSERERRARLDRLAGERKALEGDVDAGRAAAARLEEAVHRRTVRAPVTGHIGEIRAVDAGGYVAAGDRLAVIVPPGVLRIVAEFAPGDIGRIRPGQTARLNLDAFPWTRFGSVAARVESAASEVVDGLVRVELSLAPGTRSSLPLAHGLTGTVEVVVERSTPLDLALRAAGAILHARAPGAATGDVAGERH